MLVSFDPEASNAVTAVVPTLPSEGYVRIETVLSVYPVSRSKLYALIRRGEFSKPKKIGATSAWNVADVRAALARLGSAA